MTAIKDGASAGRTCLAMAIPALSLAQRTAWLAAAAIAIAAAGLLCASGTSQSLPVLGSLPLLPATFVAAVIGIFLNSFVTAGGVAPDTPIHQEVGLI